MPVRIRIAGICCRRTVYLVGDSRLVRCRHIVLSPAFGTLGYRLKSNPLAISLFQSLLNALGHDQRCPPPIDSEDLRTGGLLLVHD